MPSRVNDNTFLLEECLLSTCVDNNGRLYTRCCCPDLLWRQACHSPCRIAAYYHTDDWCQCLIEMHWCITTSTPRLQQVAPNDPDCDSSLKQGDALRSQAWVMNGSCQGAERLQNKTKIPICTLLSAVVDLASKHLSDPSTGVHKSNSSNDIYNYIQ